MMRPHPPHFVSSLDVAPSEAAPHRPVPVCAGSLGAAAFSPSGASPSFEAARREVL